MPARSKQQIKKKKERMKNTHAPKQWLVFNLVWHQHCAVCRLQSALAVFAERRHHLSSVGILFTRRHWRWKVLPAASAYHVVLTGRRVSPMPAFKRSSPFLRHGHSERVAGFKGRGSLAKLQWLSARGPVSMAHLFSLSVIQDVKFTTVSCGMVTRHLSP